MHSLLYEGFEIINMETKIANVMSFDLIIHDVQKNENIREASTKPISNYGGNGVKTSWRLKLQVFEDQIGVYLGMEDISNMDTKIAIIYKIYIIDNEGKDANIKTGSNIFNKGDVHGFENFIYKNYLRTLGNQLMPDGNLTVRCDVRFIDGNGDNEIFHRHFEKMKEEVNFQGNRADLLEEELAETKNTLSKSQAELVTARETINKLQTIQLKNLEVELQNVKERHMNNKIEMENKIAVLSEELKQITKGFQEKCQEMEKQRLNYEHTLKDFDQVKIELELVKAVTESLESNSSGQSSDTDTKVEEEEESKNHSELKDWEKLDYDYSL